MHQTQCSAIANMVFSVAACEVTTAAGLRRCRRAPGDLTTKNTDTGKSAFSAVAFALCAISKRMHGFVFISLYALVSKHIC